MSRGFTADELLALFLRLVETPSPSGQERAVADLILEYLRPLGFAFDEDDSAPLTGAGSGNILVTVPGRGAGAAILLGAHIDTVAVSGRVEVLFTASEEVGLRGAKAFDMASSSAPRTVVPSLRTTPSRTTAVTRPLTATVSM